MRKRLKKLSLAAMIVASLVAAQSAMAVTFSSYCKNNTVYINTLDDQGHIIGTRWYYVTSCQNPV